MLPLFICHSISGWTAATCSSASANSSLPAKLPLNSSCNAVGSDKAHIVGNGSVITLLFYMELIRDGVRPVRLPALPLGSAARGRRPPAVGACLAAWHLTRPECSPAGVGFIALKCVSGPYVNAIRCSVRQRGSQRAIHMIRRRQRPASPRI